MSAGDAIRRARERKGWSQNDLAQRVGVSQPAIKKIEKGETVKSKHLAKIAQLLSLKLSEVDPALSVDALAADTIPGVELLGPRDLPVYGTAEGGEGAMVVSTDPVEYVARPFPLATVQGGYGIIISGESMEPEFWAGDIALIHPHMPPTPDSAYIFYRDDGNGAVHVLCKRLVRATSTAWLVRQWNPREGEPREFELKRTDWPKVHRVIGKFSRR